MLIKNKIVKDINSTLHSFILTCFLKSFFRVNEATSNKEFLQFKHVEPQIFIASKKFMPVLSLR